MWTSWGRDHHGLQRSLGWWVLVSDQSAGGSMMDWGQRAFVFALVVTPLIICLGACETPTEYRTRKAGEMEKLSYNCRETCRAAGASIWIQALPGTSGSPVGCLCSGPTQLETCEPRLHRDPNAVQ